MGFYFGPLNVEGSCNVGNLRSNFKTMEGYFVKYRFTYPKRILFQCRDKLIIRKGEAKVPWVIEPYQSIEKSLINIRLETLV